MQVGLLSVDSWTTPSYNAHVFSIVEMPVKEETVKVDRDTIKNI